MATSAMSLSALSSSLFDGVEISAIPTGTLPSVTGHLRSIKVYQLSPEDAPLRLSVLAYLTVHGRSTSSSIASWESWVLSMISIAFHGMADKIVDQSGGEYHRAHLPAEFINHLKAAEQVIETPENPQLVGLPVPIVTAIPDFPHTPLGHSVDLYNCASVRSVYGYISIMTFLMGKQITPANRDNFKKSRPQNVIDKFSLSEDQCYILTGEGRFSDHGLGMINAAWNSSTAGRKAVVTEFVTFRQGPIQAQEVIFFLFRLLENSYMQPAYFIHQLIKAVPEVATIPVLRPAFELYAQSVKDFSKFPAHLRPYVKLMFGDTTKLFHSKSLQDLTACAVLFLGQDNDTVKAYSAPGGAKAKVAFKKLCSKLEIDIEDFAMITGSTANI